jgi:hypothetical protein
VFDVVTTGTTRNNKRSTHNPPVIGRFRTEQHLAGLNRNREYEKRHMHTQLKTHTHDNTKREKHTQLKTHTQITHKEKNTQLKNTHTL